LSGCFFYSPVWSANYQNQTDKEKGCYYARANRTFSHSCGFSPPFLEVTTRQRINIREAFCPQSALFPLQCHILRYFKKLAA